MEKGYVQVYTGNGKGKTTAALGLGMRAVGGGFKVVMFQFLKGAACGELNSSRLFGGRFDIVRLAETDKFVGTLNENEMAELKTRLQKELAQVRNVMNEQSCDILILDEIMAAVHAGLLTVEELCSLIKARPAGMELVLTGRNAPEEVLLLADLVTEMHSFRHYMDRGVVARKGIEK